MVMKTMCMNMNAKAMLASVLNAEGSALRSECEDDRRKCHLGQVCEIPGS